MSTGFMFAIAAMYLAAAIAFYVEGKLPMFMVALCWGIGNAMLGLESLK